MQVPRVGVVVVSSSGRSSRLVSTPPIVKQHTGVEFFMRPCPCLSYPSWCGSFIYCCWEAVQLVFTSFSKRIVSYVAVELVCPMGDELRIFLPNHLRPLLPCYLKRCWIWPTQLYGLCKVQMKQWYKVDISTWGNGRHMSFEIGTSKV